MSFRGTFSALSVNGYQSGINYWFPIQTLPGPTPTSISMSEFGDYIALSDGRIYLKSGTTWSLQTTIPGIASQSVSINANGDTVAFDNLVYFRTGTTWALQATLIAGSNVSLDNTGNYLILGNAAFNDPGLPFTNEGRAYFYTRTAGVWTLRQTLNPNFVNNNLNNFGTAVTFSGNSNYVAIGAPRTSVDPGGPITGMVYIYTRVGNTLNLSITAPPIQPGGNDLGRALNMDYVGNIVATDDTWGTTTPRGIWYFDQTTGFNQTFIDLSSYNNTTVQMVTTTGLKSNYDSSEIIIGLRFGTNPGTLNLNNYSGPITSFQNIKTTVGPVGLDIAAKANYIAIGGGNVAGVTILTKN
jgi:hypothetical protein